MSGKKSGSDRATTIIALVICVSGVGFLGYGALWLAWKTGELIWG